jgi:glycosyltransferase involved in cell wall biosynthesis
MARDGRRITRAGPSVPKRIRVAWIIGSAEVGGAEHLILSLMRHLPAEEFEGSVICPSPGPMVARYAQVAARVGTVGRRSFVNPFVILRMAWLLRRWRIDVVHTCLYDSDAGGILAARLAGVRRVISHIVGHNFFVTDERGWPRARKRLWSWIYRWVYRLADQLIAVSEAVKTDLVARRGIAVSPRKIVVIRHSVAQEAMAVAPEHVERVKQLCGITEASVVIAAIASLIPLKGHRYLIEALPAIVGSVSNLRCLVVGDGPHRAAIEQLVRRLGLAGHVVFTGVLDEEEKKAVIHLSRAVVLPSLSEGLPVVLLEAMALGKPIVATDVGGIRELIDDQLSGILVRPRDPEALAAAIVKVASDQAWAEGLGRAGRRRFEQAFSFPRVIDRLRAMYLANGLRCG